MVAHPFSPWNQHTETILVRMHAEGKRTRSIAEAIQGMGYLQVTKNSVIGKIHRMKLPSREPSEPPRKRPKIVFKTAQKRRPLMRRLPPTPIEPLPTSPPSGPGAVPFLEVRDGQCKAIIAYRDGKLSQAICCGHKARRVSNGHKAATLSWCDYHLGIYTRESY